MSVKKSNISCKVDPCIRDKSTQEQIFMVLKCISYVVCIIAFFLNSAAIFRDYDKKKKVVSTKVVPSPNGGLESPMFVICNTTAFKERTMDTSLDGYKNNTMRLDDVLLDAFFVEAVREVSVFQHVQIKNDVKEVATMMHGNCLVLDQKRQLRADDLIWIELKATFDLELYVMNHGDDVFVPLNVWPKHPSKTELVKDNLFTEIRLTKESTVLQDGCNITEGYAYGDCIREQFIQFYRYEKNELFARCSVPWMMDLIISPADDLMFPSPCNESDATYQSFYGMEFFYKAATYAFPSCKEPCLSSSYKIETIPYERKIKTMEHLAELYKASVKITDTKEFETNSVLIKFPNMETHVSEEVHINTMNSFISSVGGNLGLFVGFSFLSLLVSVSECISKHVSRII